MSCRPFGTTVVLGDPLKRCHKCSTEWEGLNQPGTRQECPECGYDMHVCLNCKFYDTSKPNQCSAGVDEVVLNKEKANFCDEFQFKQSGAKITAGGSTAKAKQTWEKLFKK